MARTARFSVWCVMVFKSPLTIEQWLKLNILMRCVVILMSSLSVALSCSYQIFFCLFFFRSLEVIVYMYNVAPVWTSLPEQSISRDLHLPWKGFSHLWLASTFGANTPALLLWSMREKVYNTCIAIISINRVRIMRIFGIDRSCPCNSRIDTKQFN